ncbi:Hypothetical protein RADP37_05443 (plasmid) [Roseomonas mucosa]|uniref:Uncharacterized protein n=1 Tax=Roseomonas mucosa TaxID=207340 RepID=A0A4Y1MQ14_9PROT|nr:Hypothetical protein RADP37_05443 [Roseomonas mucosa]
MGSRLDADHPSNRVPIPCRSTADLDDLGLDGLDHRARQPYRG